MMKRTHGSAACSALAAILVLTGCATTPDRTSMLEDLRRARILSERSIAELQAIRPQLPLPFRLGIAPPLEVEGRGFGRSGLEFGSWSAEERSTLEEAGRELQGKGILTDVVILPTFLTEISGEDDGAGFLIAARRAAARHDVDAVLVTRTLTRTNTGVNPLALLNLTIVGAFVVPGHDGESVTMMEAAIFDVSNEYLYASAMGEGLAEASYASANSGFEVSALGRQSRAMALEKLVEAFDDDLGYTLLNVQRRRVAPAITRAGRGTRGTASGY